MLEYNGDTPSVLVESSNVSNVWKNDKHKDHFQSNFMDKSITHALSLIFKDMKNARIGIACITNDEESKGTAQYLNNLCIQNGLKSSVFDIENFELHYDSECNHVHPSDRGQNLDCLFRLYPLEWIA